MKTKIFSFIIFLLFVMNISTHSQEVLMSCVSSDPPTVSALPSTGTVNVLIVFAQFPDDNYDINNSLWVKGQAPSNMNNWINQTWTSSPIQGSLTHYFNDMSWNPSTNTARLKFIGKTVSVTSPHSRQWYLDNAKNRWDIHKEILNSLDVTWNFAEFDNWNASGNNTPDGKIDMIIFIWRNIAKELTNEATVQTNLNFDNDYGSLGFVSSPIYFEVDGGLRKVYANDWGSGVTIRNYVANGHQQEFRITVHELAHYLLAHHNEYHNGFGFWGMLSAWGIRSIVPNSFERNQLGWLNNLQTISSSTTQTIPNVQLGDYVSTGNAVALEINSSAGEYFYIENHQATSYWETTFAFGNIEPGMYVIRKVGAPNQTNPSSWLQLISADGRFNWEVNQSVNNPWGSGQLPVFKQLVPNKNSGYHDNQLIPFSYGGLTSPAPIHFTENPITGLPVEDIRFHGDGKDAFRVGYNQVFSPWSNPNNQRTTNQTTPFGFEITNLSNGIYTLNLYVNTSINASPSKPQNARTSGLSSEPTISWDTNTETDISSYKVYRSINNASYQLIAGNVTTTSITDNLHNIINTLQNVKYKVIAKDNQNLLSVYSEPCTLTFTQNSGGTISSNTTWSGNMNITGDVTVNSGVTLTINSGAQLYFSPNKQLVVNGTLNVQGTSSDTVRFMLNGTSGNWLGIRFNNGSSGSINYAKIQKSTWGIFFNNLGNNNISVSYSRIQDNSSYGIWFANSSLMTIQRNHIINNGSYGIYCDNYSSPYIYYNMIRKHSIAGLYCNYYSSPYASTSGGAGNNVIKDNSGYGLYANYNSNPHFGDGTSYAYNSIYLNTSDEVKATNGCNVWVQNDYWGSGFSFNADQTSTIHHEYQLATDPNQGRTLIVDPGDNKTNTARVNLNVGSNGLSLKNKVETVSDYSDELSQWLDVFKKERNTLNGRYALIKIEECYSKAKKDGFEEFVNAEIFSRKGVKDELTVMGLELINHSLMSKGDYNAVIKNLEKIKNGLLLNESIEKNTLYALGSIYLNSINDKTKASKYFEELKQKFPNDLLVYNSELLLGNNPDPKLFKEAGTDETQSKNEVPANLELSGNYPNPFNPTTIINYSLPEDGNVQIKVFDVLGREVATLINGFNSSGKHNVAWDGTKFASGIYFYSITFKDQTLYKKMLLMK